MKEIWSNLDTSVGFKNGNDTHEGHNKDLLEN